LLEDAAGRFRRSGNLPRLVTMLSRVGYMAMAANDYDAATGLLEQALDVARSVGEPLELAIVRGNQGLAALFRGEHEPAAQAFREELRISRQHAFRSLAAEAIGGLGAVAARRGQRDRAARLCGAFVTHTHAVQALDRRLRDEIFAPSRTRFGAEAWDRCCDEGREMTLDEAATYALI
jgi:tetratricopeptide (TPR) repeat protein